MGAVLNEKLELLAGAIEDSADLKSFGFPQFLVQLKAAGGRGNP